MCRPGVGILAAVAILLACGPSASSPAAAPARPPAEAAPLSDAAYRQQVVDAARAEGEVNATIHTSWPPEGLRRLEDAMEREYGVRIRINFTPVGNFPQRTAQLLGELEANVNPSFDLYQSSDTTSALMRRADALEQVNWTPLLPAGTPAKVIAQGGYHIAPYTDSFALLSDPTVISDADVPRSLKDLANPRWRGKAMLALAASSYVQWMPTLGRDETLATLRAIMQNGALVETYPNQFTRFTSKEFPMIMIGGTFYEIALKRGIPARFTPLDFLMITERHLSIPRRAQHPNAAKLLAAIQAGPEGQQILADSLGAANRYYENSIASKLEQEAGAAGFPVYSWDESEASAIALGPEGDELTREIDRIFKGE